MKDRLSSYTEIVSYFLWELTRNSNALALWYCAEDIGFFLEGRRIFNTEQLNEILLLSKLDEDYIEFVRQISYRIFMFTGDNDKIKNWFIAERLLQHNEWVSALLGISSIYAEVRGGNYEIADTIRTEKFRKLYSQ